MYKETLQYIIDFLTKKNISNMVVHGLRTSHHSHKYIHGAIYKIFLYIASKMPYKVNVLWCDDDASEIYNDYSNYFIFSSPHYNTDKYLPILDNAYYILHYRTHNVINNKHIVKYSHLLRIKKAVKYVEFRGLPKDYINKKKIKFINPLFWYYYDVQSNLEGQKYNTNELNIPWATNLLPEEIDKNMDWVMEKHDYNKKSYFCGSIWKTNNDEVKQWKSICLKKKIHCLFDKEEDEIKHQEKVRSSLLAPAFQGESQHYSQESFYIPCRIFKNISFGALPITNNIGVYNMFKEYTIIYDEKLDVLFDKVLEYRNYEKENKEQHLENMMNIMNNVKNNHTFLNRIHDLIFYGLTPS